MTLEPGFTDSVAALVEACCYCTYPPDSTDFQADYESDLPVSGSQECVATSGTCRVEKS